MPSLVSGGVQRLVSSPAGLSTLITSAPRSASSIVQYGPARTLEKSATTSPDSGPGTAWLMVSRCLSVRLADTRPDLLASMVRCQARCQDAGTASGTVMAGAAWHAAQSALIAPAAASKSGR